MSSEDYLSIKNDFKDSIFFNKQEILFNKNSRNKKFRSDILSKPIKTLSYSKLINSISLFNDDCLSLVNNLNKKNFKPFYNEILIDSLDDSYEKAKYSFNLLLDKQKYISLNNLNFISPISYTQILNAFRGNYEEFC
jgi:hypothetical protein